MKKLTGILTLLLIVFIANAQILETGKTIEYRLSAEDNNTGTFYLGRFSIGQYEIFANFGGIHANNTGWKIIVGSNWGWNGVTFKEVFSNIKGEFIYQKHDNASFDLWWDAKYGSSGYNWTPHIKVEYQIGNCVYNNPEPSRTNSKVIKDNSKMSIHSINVADKIGIGTTSPSAKLDVAGNIKAHEIEVTLAAMHDLQLNGTLAANNITYTANGNTADFVFEDNYHLKDLSEVEAFIKTNKHLPEIPSANEMEETGVNLAEMNKLLLMKVEELTLYSIEQEKALIDEAVKRKALEERLNKLEELLTNLNKK